MKNEGNKERNLKKLFYDFHCFWIEIEKFLNSSIKIYINHTKIINLILNGIFSKYQERSQPNKRYQVYIDQLFKSW